MSQKSTTKKVACIFDGQKLTPVIRMWESSMGWIWIATRKPYPVTDPDCYYGFVVGLANEWGTWNAESIMEIWGYKIWEVPRSKWASKPNILMVDKDQTQND